MNEKLEKIINKYNELNAILSNGSISSSEYGKTAKEMSELTDIVELSKQYFRFLNEIAILEAMLEDVSQEEEMRKMAEEELMQLRPSIADLEQQIKIALLPKDTADSKNAIIEIRAGTGGDEAALFAAVLFRMYNRYAEQRGWKFEIISVSETCLNGYKEAIASISGNGAFARLKFESGVHRVQRIPETESNGRIHTSAATVAVLPEAEEFDIAIDEKDLEIDVFRASGAGGQHVNTTDSAVRITHKPSGLVVVQQDERSQHKNKARAMKILRTRLYEMERQQKQNERAAMRKWQVGSGDRSERIRTYNFPQGRITDHRINVTLYNINSVLENAEIDELIDQLIANYNMERLCEEI